MKRIDCPSGGGPARKSFVSSCAPIQTSLGPPFFFLFYLQFWDVVAMQGRIYLQACQRLGGDGPIYSVCCLLPNIEKPLVLHFFFFFFGCESGWNVSVSAAAERERERERETHDVLVFPCVDATAASITIRRQNVPQMSYVRSLFVNFADWYIW